MFTPLLDVLLLFTIVTPLIGLLVRKMKHNWILRVYTISALVSSFILIPIFYSKVLDGNVITVALGGSVSPVEFCLKIDLLSLFMTMIYLFIGVVVSVFSIRDVKRGLTGYYTVLLGMVAGMVGVTFAGDLFILFIFWEVMCISSYALVVFRREEPESVEAGYKYLIMSGAGSITILFALSFLYGVTGTLNIAYVSTSLINANRNAWVLIALTMIIAGFGLQAGMVPLHTWLPDAHSAALSSISAVLSGIMVKTGVYGLIRVLLVVFASLYATWQITLALFAVLTMFVGNLLALLQDDIKRLIACSTIANIGYILLGVAVRSQASLTGSLFHILNHAVVKALLFFCAGAFVYETKTRSLKELAGIGRSMPITSSFFIVGVLSLTGIPPLNFFWSELVIISSGVEAGMATFSLLMILNLSLSAVYCLRMIQTVALKKSTTKSKKAKEAPLPMLIPITVLVFLSILIGLYPGPFWKLAEAAAKTALNYISYIEAAT